MPLGLGQRLVRAALSAAEETYGGAPELIGPPYQREGGVWVVDSEYDVDRLHERLMSAEVAGLDCETVDINPMQESPATGKGRICVWSCAYFDERLGTHPQTGKRLAQRVFVPNYGKAEEGRWLYRFQDWFESDEHKKVLHAGFSFDRLIWANHGIDLRLHYDTLRMSRLHDTNRLDHDLKVWGAELGYEMYEYRSLFSRPMILKSGRPGKKLVLAPLTEVVLDPTWRATLVDYASLDAKVCLELYEVLAERLARRPWREVDGRWLTMLDYYDVKSRPYGYVINGAEMAGWDLDEMWCAEQSERALRDMNALEQELVAWAGAPVNFRSTVQLQQFLYGSEPAVVVKKGSLVPGKGFPIPRVKKSKTAERPTDAVALDWLETHVHSKRDRAGLRTLIRWKKAGKMREYLVKLPRFRTEQGRVHCQLAPETDTGRLAAKNPPLQQIPRPDGDAYKIREAFTCPPGWTLVGGDWSQLEMRILAHYLVVLFDDHVLANDLEGSDLHAATAKRVFHLDCPVDRVKKEHPDARNKGKVLNFKVNYGGTEYSIGRELRDEDGDPIGTEAAREILDAYFVAYSAIRRYQRWAINYARKKRCARTLLGRYRDLPEILHPDEWVRGHAERQALNTPIQGSAADVASEAMLKCNTLRIRPLLELGYFDEELARMGAQLVMQIHDELIFRCPAAHAVEVRDRVKFIMENPLDKPLTVPLPAEVNIGMSWAECK